MTEYEKLRADYAASVSLLTDDERQQLWEGAKAYVSDWLEGKIPRTPESLSKCRKQWDIVSLDCDPDAPVEFDKAMPSILTKSIASRD